MDILLEHEIVGTKMQDAGTCRAAVTFGFRASWLARGLC